MQLEKIPLADTHAFSSFFLDYIQGADSLQSFYHRAPSIENFHDQLQEKSTFPLAHRQVLSAALQRQYKAINPKGKVRENLESISSPTTFTVTTGHQLNIFTGPLYFIYKIITVINICHQLREQYPGYSFIPVYWMAAEDHDFAEISYFRLAGKKYEWSTDQTGAVGRFDLKSIAQLLNEVPGDIRPFNDAYRKSANLSDAVRYYVDALFGAEGIVVVDGDDHYLKGLLAPVMEADLFSNVPQHLVEAQDAKLKGLGYTAQVHARPINFFFLDAGIRGRIEKDKDGFSVVDTTLRFSAQQIKDLIREQPEKLSPNVILRPLYQEIILPNLAYVGGPAEVVYWLQLKSMFEHFGIPFPILLPRNFAMIIDLPTFRKFKKLELNVKDLFEEKDQLYKRWVLKNTHHDLVLEDVLTGAREIFASIQRKIQPLDPTLGPMVSAEEKRTINGLEKIEKKMLRAEKRKHIEKLRQIEAVKEMLFPHGSLQERTDNFLNFYQLDPKFLQKLISQFDPFDFRFNVLSELD